MYQEDMKKVKILVVGDIMLDRYICGAVDRISPEAPVPVVNVKEEYHTMGGAGNVVRNIRELGAQVDCLASVAQDIEGKIIDQELTRIGSRSLLCIGSERTTVKERIIAEHRLVQMLRIDREVKRTVVAKDLIKVLEDHSDYKYNMVIISDYAKGVVTHELIKYIKENINAPIIVDPKPQNAWMYNDVLMITPNEKEWMQMQLSSKPGLKNIKYVLQTMGKKGMKLIEGHKEWFIEAVPVDIYNVSGCGDVVVATISVCLAMGIPVYTAAKISNRCAGYTATLPGTSIVPKDKFIKIVNDYI
jgi:rfaE bifunctional protein kinase chain/domain